ncbi:MAG: polysaccharide export protein [Acetobacteraceae bacterium]|nr:polysaccharide export protein [Acetobacteraceae bacterium]
MLASFTSSCAPSGGPAPTATTSTDTATYVIGAGDTLGVFVYQSPQLSEDGVAVRPDGKISIPLVQDIQAAGLTPDRLAQNIAKRLTEYVKDPHVTVIVKSFVGPLDSQIKVIGEAAEPQAIPYRDGMHVLDVLIATKGLTKYAAGNRALIVRHLPHGKTEDIHVHLSDLINDGDMRQNVSIEPGDTLIIPQSWF